MRPREWLKRLQLIGEFLHLPEEDPWEDGSAGNGNVGWLSCTWIRITELPQHVHQGNA